MIRLCFTPVRRVNITSLTSSSRFSAIFHSRHSLSTLPDMIETQDTNLSSVSDALGRIYATGRRKTSVARVWIREGSGQFIVNERNVIDYFQPVQREHILSSFLASKTAGFFDVWCTVKGGGISGQAGAVRLGISRALDKYNPDLRPALRQGKFV